jgi:hypothetical protein
MLANGEQHTILNMHFYTLLGRSLSPLTLHSAAIATGGTPNHSIKSDKREILQDLVSSHLAERELD